VCVSVCVCVCVCVCVWRLLLRFEGNFLRNLYVASTLNQQSIKATWRQKSRRTHDTYSRTKATKSCKVNTQKGYIKGLRQDGSHVRKDRTKKSSSRHERGPNSKPKANITNGQLTHRDERSTAVTSQALNVRQQFVRFDRFVEEEVHPSLQTPLFLMTKHIG